MYADNLRCRASLKIIDERKQCQVFIFDDVFGSHGAKYLWNINYKKIVSGN